jgi:hypothetical protein
MYYKRIALAISLTLLTCSVGRPHLAQNGGAKQKEIQVNDLYYPILDILFPDHVEILSPGGCSVSATLRFIPPGDPESQINVCIERADGEPKVIQYYLPPGSDSIWSRLFDLYHRSELDTHDPAQLAKRFKVEVRTVKISNKRVLDLLGQLDKLHFPSTKRPEPGIVTVAEGTEHVFWYETDLCKVHLSYNYTPSGDEGGFGRAVAEWMDRVKIAVDSVR